MSDYKIVEDIIGVQPLTATNTAQQHPIGFEVRAVDMQSGNSSVSRGAGVFVYAQGSNVTAQGQFVHLVSGSAVLLASANSASLLPVGVAAGNLSATNAYGWVQVQGVADYARGTNSSIPANAPLYFCGTAGLLISNSAAGSRIHNVFCPASYTSSQSASLTVYLNRPYIAALSNTGSAPGTII